MGSLSPYLKSVFILFGLILLLPSLALATHLKVGERLEFDLFWGGIPAGKTVMTIEKATELNGRSAIHAQSRSWSTGFVSTFYDVNQTLDSFMNAEDYSTLKYDIRKVKRGKKKTRSFVYDYDKNQVHYRKGKKSRVYDVAKNFYDSLSSIYYLRTQKLSKGKDITMQAFSKGKLYEVNVKVLGKEKIKVDAGTFDTIKVSPKFLHDDVFKSKGDMFIWLTDDEEKIPVLIKTKIKVGHIKAKLTKLKRGEEYVH